MTLIERINSQIRGALYGYLCQWLPGGRLEGAEYVVRNPRRADSRPGSFKINIQSCVFKDFATGDGGNDPVALYAYVNGLAMADAVRELAKELAVETALKVQLPPTQPAENMRIIMPVPESEALPPAKGRQWAYRDAAGRLLGFIERRDKPDGSKDFFPLTLWDEGGKLSWKRKIWPEPRPLYGLELLAANPKGAVLIVEGEKTADAARRLISFALVVTWPGGANSIGKIDWSPLAGRAVAIWPDNDSAGIEAAEKIAALLHGSAQYVKLIEPPVTAAKGWDLADAEAEKWTPPMVREHIATRWINWEPPQLKESSVSLNSAPVYSSEPPPENLPAPGTVERSQKHLGFPDVAKNGPRATVNNLAYLLEHLGIIARYNVISKEEEVLIPGHDFSIDNKANASLAWILSEAKRVGLPTDNFNQYITYLADQNPHNPVANWILSKPWDGRSRLDEFFATITAKGEAEDRSAKELKEILIQRWLVSAVAAAFEPRGVSAHGVLVFQGEQYLGKTHWFKRLVPKDLGVIADGMMLKPDDRDSVKQAVSNWLVELGELDATFRKADIAQLKSFLTRDKDVLRRAYAVKESEYARRTVFFASVNPKEFLHDATGNRRFWTIECEAINYMYDIDMQQLWAEVHALYVSGYDWRLTHGEVMLLNEHNSNFEVKDPIEERIKSRLRWDAPEGMWEWKTATDALMAIGIDRPNHSETMRASQVIRGMNGGRYKKTNGQRVLFIPPTAGSYGSTPPLPGPYS